MPDSRRTRRRIASEKRHLKVTRPQLVSLQKRVVTLRPLSVVIVALTIAGVLLLDAGMNRVIVALFGAGVAGFLVLASVLRCPACQTPLEVVERLGPLLPRKLRCPRCDVS